MRERGLKYISTDSSCYHYGRSREGAWIEIDATIGLPSASIRRSREGAWIEMPTSLL